MHTRLCVLRPILATLIGISTTSAFADLDWQAKARLSHSQQSYEDQQTYAQLPSQEQNQLLLSSLWQADDWDLSLSLPLIAMDANYQVEPGRTPNLCARVQAARPQKLARWVRSGRVTQKTIDRCLTQAEATEPETVSGLGDARLEVNRYWQLGDALEMSLGSGAKAATGEVEKNLGTGRESLYLMTGITYLWQNLSAGVSGEFSQYLGQGDPDEQDTTQSLAAHLDWQWQPNISMGVFSRWESASYSDEDDLTSTGLTLAYQPIKNLSLGLSFEHFQANSQGLSRSISGYIAYSAF